MGWPWLLGNSPALLKTNFTRLGSECLRFSGAVGPETVLAFSGKGDKPIGGTLSESMRLHNAVESGEFITVFTKPYA